MKNVITYIALIFSFLLLLMAIFSPDITLRGMGGVVSKWALPILLRRIILFIIAFGIFFTSIKYIMENITYQFKVKRKYYLKITSNFEAFIESIAGKGDSILNFNIQEITKPIKQELQLKILVAGKNLDKENSKILIISPNYVDNEYKIKVREKGFWTIKIFIKCLSKMKEELDVIANVKILCRTKHTSIPPNILIMNR